MTRNTVVYIDGFNFYYGLLRSGPYRRCKWLDLQRLFTRLRNDDTIVSIKYFSAFWPDESGERHREYVRALGSTPIVEPIIGTFKRKTLVCGVRACAFGKKQFTSFEEKETDVNIALHMLDDAYQGLCERIVLLSADSDLVPAINLVKSRFPEIAVNLYVPGPSARFRNAIDIRSACDSAKVFPAGMLSKFQLPNSVVVDGRTVTKPSSW